MFPRTDRSKDINAVLSSQPVSGNISGVHILIIPRYHVHLVSKLVSTFKRDRLTRACPGFYYAILPAAGEAGPGLELFRYRAEHDDRGEGVVRLLQLYRAVAAVDNVAHDARAIPVGGGVGFRRPGELTFLDDAAAALGILLADEKAAGPLREFHIDAPLFRLDLQTGFDRVVKEV